MSYDPESHTTVIERCPEQVTGGPMGGVIYRCENLSGHPPPHACEYGPAEGRHRIEWWIP